MPNCGSQVYLCDLPVRYDTYIGCSHACKYCFVKRKNGDISSVNVGESTESLKRFIEGARNKETDAFDWNIPLHIGGLSDPFQPCEAVHRKTYDAMKILADAGYPFVISTKGRLVAAPEYLELFDKCNAVIQISMACSRYDKIERGAPKFEERLEMLRAVSKHCKRSIVRVQPYFHECFSDIKDNIKKFADAGAYGIIIEGIKCANKKAGLVKCGTDYVYPLHTIKNDFEKLRDEAHKCGIKIFAGENRIRAMGDSLTCCGCDGLEGFRQNKFNVSHLINGDIQKPTDRMKEKGSGGVFSAIYQYSMAEGRAAAERSFSENMVRMMVKKEKFIKDVFGK